MNIYARGVRRQGGVPTHGRLIGQNARVTATCWTERPCDARPRKWARSTEEQLREVVAAYYPYEKIGEKTLAAFQDVAIEASRRAEDAEPTKRGSK
jgi:hypothetical protein